MADFLEVDRKTIVRKFLFMAAQAKLIHDARLNSGTWKVDALQFDEMEAFEHTRLKPLSIALAVDAKTGDFLAASVSSFAAKGKMATFAIQKYGFRPDLRQEGRKDVLEQLQYLAPQTITTDFHPAYPTLIRNLLTNTQHEKVKRVKQKRNFFHKNRRRNLKDKLFRLNFSAAKIRHDLSRMGRKVWVTTKKLERLQAHLNLYFAFHNKYEFQF
jgi:IS1 family transposase